MCGKVIIIFLPPCLRIGVRTNFFLGCFFRCFQSEYNNFNFLLMNIFISNLNFKVEDNDLKQLFEEYGEVSSAKVVTDRYTGRSRGFGFVEMPDDEAAQKAINELNQVEYDNKVITVNEARPRENRPARGGRSDDRRRGGGYGDRSGNKRW